MRVEEQVASECRIEGGSMLSMLEIRVPDEVVQYLYIRLHNELVKVE